MFEYYKDFELKKITTTKFRHLFFLFFWPVYLILFILTEQLIVPSYNVYSPIDDAIPFCEFFVIPYVLWYALLAFVSLYTLFFDIPAFKKFYLFLCVSSAITFAAYIIFPNGQNLRPEEFTRNNFFVDFVKNLYTVDTNTNVCPSIHVVFSFGMLFTLWDTKHFGTTFWRIISILTAFLVSFSTVFLKQHSVVDIFAGIGLSIIIFPFTFKNIKLKNIFLKKE